MGEPGGLLSTCPACVLPAQVPLHFSFIATRCHTQLLRPYQVMAMKETAQISENSFYDPFRDLMKLRIAFYRSETMSLDTYTQNIPLTQKARCVNIFLISSSELLLYHIPRNL